MLLSYRDMLGETKLSSEEIPQGNAPSEEQATFLDALALSFRGSAESKRAIVIAPPDADNPIGRFISLDTKSFSQLDGQYEGTWGTLVASNDFSERDNIMRYIAACVLGGIIPDGVRKFAILVGTARRAELMAYLPGIAERGIHLVNAFGVPGSKDTYDPLHDGGYAAGDDRSTRSGEDIKLLKPDPEKASAFTPAQRKAAMIASFARQWDSQSRNGAEGELTRDMYDRACDMVSFYSYGQLSLSASPEECVGTLPYPLSCTVLPAMTDGEQELEDVLNKAVALQFAAPAMYDLSGFSVGRSELARFSSPSNPTGELPPFPGEHYAKYASKHNLELLGRFCREPFDDGSVAALFKGIRQAGFESGDIIGRLEPGATPVSPTPTEIAALLPERHRMRSSDRQRSAATAVLADLVDLVSSFSPQGGGYNNQVFGFMLVRANNLYDAVGFQYTPGRWELQEMEAQDPDGDWGVLLAPITGDNQGLGLAALASGTSPDGVSKLLVVSGPWQNLSQEEIAEVRETVSHVIGEGIPVIADLSEAGISDAGDAGLGEKLAINDSWQGRKRNICLASPEHALPELREILVPACEYARCGDVGMMIGRALPNGNALFGDDMMGFLSMGMTRASGCTEIFSQPGFNGLNIREMMPMLNVVYPARKDALPEWAKPAIEFSDLCRIWQYAAASGGLNLKPNFPEGTSRSECYRVARLLGVPSMLEAYYEGVPVGDIVEES